MLRPSAPSAKESTSGEALVKTKPSREARLYLCSLLRCGGLDYMRTCRVPRKPSRLSVVRSAILQTSRDGAILNDLDAKNTLANSHFTRRLCSCALLEQACRGDQDLELARTLEKEIAAADPASDWNIAAFWPRSTR